MKFKVGDKVVVANPDSTSQIYGIYKGTTFVIEKEHGSFYYSTSIAIGLVEEELEFETIYNSPLYAAMMEEE